MSDLTALSPSAPQPRPAAASASSALKTDAPPKLAVGMRLEVSLDSLSPSGEAQIRVRAPDAQGQAWSAPMNAQIAPEQLAAQGRAGARLASAPALGAQPSATQPPATQPSAVTAGQGQPPQGFATASSAGAPARAVLAEVVATSPTLVLRPLPATSQPSPQLNPGMGALTPEWVDQQLRQHLPRARPLGATLDRLNTEVATLPGGLQQAGPDKSGAASSKAASGAPAADVPSATLGRQLAALLAALPDAGSLTQVTRLAQSLQQSGIWLESLLAHAGRDPTRAADLGLDLKARLLQLANELARHTSASPEALAQSAAELLELSPKELAREVDAMLKQIVTLQLQSREAAHEEMRWLLELPFRTDEGVESMHADIRRGGGARTGEDEVWTMQLHLNLPQLGPLRVRLSWRNERLSASLVAERGESAERLRAQLDELRARFVARELDVAGVHAGQGPVGERPRWRGPLLNERA